MTDGAAGGKSADDLERLLLGGDPDISLAALAEAAGLSPEVASLFWHALGFPDTEPAGRMFTRGDKDAIVTLARLITDIGSDEEFVVGLIRAMGHQMARLAMWQVIAMVEQMSDQAGDAEAGAERAVNFLYEHVDDFGPLLVYAFRRHLAAVVKWRLDRVTEDARRMRLSVGFADMAGYTRLSRNMDPLELARLVNRFETVASDVVLRQGGRVIKTVGDEILFASDTAVQAVDIGLDLADAMDTDPMLPQVRVGVATGEVVARMGDVYGPTVNLASRLTSLSNPSRVLIEGNTAAAIAEAPHLEAATLGEAVLQDFGTVHMFGVRRN
ncbi:adenylate/guanylate cyclase domain-containing protein [Sporichthya brevicatena]|uniref:Adenylate/guanylate cyclase domain-containing protein n=1 Tax=Sporichthya brevicatena TaxID=171442 RepID=A0ABN1H7Q7_9ACTN